MERPGTPGSTECLLNSFHNSITEPCTLYPTAKCVLAIFRISSAFRRVALLKTGNKYHQHVACDLCMPRFQ